MKPVVFGDSFDFLFSLVVLVAFERKLHRMHLKVNDEHIRGRIMAVGIGSAYGYGLTQVPFHITGGLMCLLFIVQSFVS